MEFAKASGNSVATSHQCSGDLFLSKVPKMELDNLCSDGGRPKSENEAETKNSH
jgi:hypothetical protein